MSKKLKNISESVNIYEIAEAIQQKNPDAEIRTADMGLDSMAYKRFFSSIPAEQLVLPKGFYHNEKNGITNKHNTKTGQYCELEVEDLKYADKRTLMPEIPHGKDVSQSTNIYEIAEAIQELNPDAEIRTGDMGLDSSAYNRFYSSIPVDQLELPKGFYYNEKNGITNKHNTKTGQYCALEVEDLEYADKRKLTPKVEKVVARDFPKTKDQLKTVKQIIINAVKKLKNKVLDRGKKLYAKIRGNSHIK